MDKPTGFEIAIIGAAGKFPGAENIDAFWNNIKTGTESISFFSEEELKGEGIDPEDYNNPAYVKANGYIEGKEYFDSKFFNYRPNESRLMDPQMRILHEYVWKAIECAGYNVDAYKGKIGLFTGSASNVNWQNYSTLLNKQEQLVDDFSLGFLNNVVYNNTRISYLLNLRGPAMAVDTACSTSLIAVHQACNSLLLGECSMALAGGIKIKNSAKRGYLYKEGMIHSPDGHCRPFDKDAGGTVSGEGVGLVVLKRLKKALADKDNILAVIKGTGINNDGNDKVGFTAPSVNGQTEAIMMAHKMAKIDPKTVGYIETHGTATNLGDPIEIEALNRAFGESSEKYCAIGSVKSNIGHCDSAAGVAGLIKAAMALKNKQLPPSLHFKEPNPKINFNNSPFYVNNQLKPWKNGHHPRRAGVSSFGIGGTNAHVVLEEAPVSPVSDPNHEQQLFVWSAKTQEALSRNKQNFREFLQNNEQIPLADIAYTLQKGRVSFAHRSSFAGSNHSELLEFLSVDDDVKIKNSEQVSTESSVVFMFSGQGSQYTNMCKDLYEKDDLFTKELDHCFQIAQKVSGVNFKAILFNENDSVKNTKINDTEFTQPLLFMVEYSLARVFMKLGVTPDKMIGHSIGEYVAACISGVFSLEDALTLVVKRGKLMQSALPGKMLSVSISEKELTPLLDGHNEISLAAVNSSKLCVVSGEENSILEFQAFIKTKGYISKVIPTSHAFHSHMMDGLLDDFAKDVSKVKINPYQIPFISNLTAEEVKDDQLSEPEYWVSHLRETVRFSQGVERLLNEQPVIFLEIGPGKALTTFVRSNVLRKKNHKVVDTMRHPKEAVNDYTRFLLAAGELWKHGVTLNWDELYLDRTPHKVWLPTYSFEKTQYPVIVDAFKLISNMISGGQANARIDFNTESETPEITAISKIEHTNVSREHDIANSIEDGLTKLWQDFFGKSDIQIDDDFLEIGGDSLNALHMIGKVHKQFGIQIPLVEFFQDATIKGLSKYIKEEKNHENASVESDDFVPISQAAQKEHFQLSSTQRRLYFLYEFNTDSLTYNLPQVVEMKGTLDRALLDSAFEKLIARHESLRTSFELINGEVVQKIHADVKIEIEEYKCKASEVPAIIKEFIRPFDLRKAPLVRFGLIKVASNQHILMVDVHHIVTDGTSHGILIKDLTALYNQQELPKVVLQYKDYAEWQQSTAQQSKLEAQKKFWLKEFEEEVNALNLPTDLPRPSVKRHSGSDINFSIGPRETAGLRALGEQGGATMYITILSLFNILLSKLGNQEDVTIGTPVAGRNHPDLAEIIGMFVNTVVLRNSVSQDLSFESFLNAVKDKALSCFDHQTYQYEDLIEDLKVIRDTSRNPLFDVMFVFQNFERQELSLPELTLKEYDNSHNVSRFDLTLIVNESDDQLNMNIEYSDDLFEKQTIERFATYFKTLVTAVLQDSTCRISEYNILPEQERDQLLNEFNNTSYDYPADKTIVDLFEEQVSRTPKKRALIHMNNAMTYATINALSNQLARYLIEKRDLRKGEIVGVLMERSAPAIVCILAIMKSGAVYLPIDPTYPTQRQHYMMQDSGIKLLLTTSDLTDNIEFPVSKISIDQLLKELNTGNQNIGTHISPDDTAYVIYTSGSTGNPKGVKVAHGSNVNMSLDQARRFDIDANDGVLQFASLSFDASIYEIFMAFYGGATLVIADAKTVKDSDNFINYLKEKAVTVATLPPSYLSVLSLEQLSFLRVLITAGEAADVEKAIYCSEFLDYYNAYGPTECAVCVSVHKVSIADKKRLSLPIGKPLSNTKLYILDAANMLLPTGAIGELCVSGVNVALGYLNNEDKTKQVFIDNPYKEEGYERLYKTGDLARWLPDGNVEFIGRVDHQVKIRGFRIELGEIESQLKLYSTINEAVVLANGTAENKYLVAYYVSEEEVDVSDLRSFMGKNLPEYMIPAYFVHQTTFPLTSNGKLDRKALPDPDLATLDDYLAPQSTIEIQLVDIWSEILQVEKEVIGVNRSFFDIGGHSLKVTLLVNRIFKEMDVQFPLREVFARQDVRSQAAYIEEVDKSSFSSIEKADKKEHYRLSATQQRLYFLHEFDKNSLAYNMPQMVYLEGELNFTRLDKAFKRLIQRHESLRTSFKMIQDKAVQIVHTSADFELIRFVSQERDVQAIISEFIRPFDLSKAPLIRVGIIKTTDHTHLLMVDVHHIVSDGVSEGILIKDFMSLYNQDELPDIRLDYKDYSEWQQSASNKDKLLEQKAFWLDQFSEEPSSLELPLDFPRPLIKSKAGGVVRLDIDKQKTRKLRVLAEQEGATMFMTILSLFNVLLNKLTNQEDIIIGTPVAGRNHADLEGIIGMFVNTVLLRNRPKGDMNFNEFLAEVKDSFISCFEHQEYQYEELIDELNITRDASRNPLFDVMLVYQNIDEGATLNIPGLVLKPYENNHQISKFDLTLRVSEAEEQLNFSLEYSKDLFEETTVKRFSKYFIQIVDHVLADSGVLISTIDILSEKEKTQLLSQFNDTAMEFPRGKTIIGLLEEQVMLTPDKIALVFEGNKLTYFELQERSNELAIELKSLPRNSGLAAIYIEPSLNMVVAVVGVLKAGMGFLPLDPDHRSNRHEEILTESKCDALVTEVNLKDSLSFSGKKLIIKEEIAPSSKSQKVVTSVRPNDIAYVIYTSGSTGKPKGVKVSHSNLVNYITWFDTAAELSPKDKLLLTTSFAFDAIYTQFFASLLKGLELHILSKENYLSPENLLEYIKSQQISMLKMTPTLFNMLLNDSHYSKNSFEHVRFLMLGGESINVQDVKSIVESDPSLKLMNHYGPTETTIGSIAQYIEPNNLNEFIGRPSIGKPIGNTFCYILGKNNELLPLGTAGELCIGGEGVGMGYLGDNQLTQQAFLDDPFHRGAKMYKTGDLARWLPDGRIEFIGRFDDQVKVRGFRIELGEIEKRLANHEDIREATVLTIDKEGDKAIVAYYISQEKLESDRLRHYLTNQLPDYMLPSYYVHLERFPLTPNGKIDRKALPDPEFVAENNYTAPRTKEEKLLCDVWTQVLAVETVGITDNFFSVGGDSIKSIQICSRIRYAGYELLVKDIFVSPTIDELALKLKERVVIADQSPVTGEVPLSPIQHRFFEGNIQHKHHFHQSVMLNFPERISEEEVRTIFTELQRHHDALRMVFKKVGANVLQENRDLMHPLSLKVENLRQEKSAEKRLLKLCNEIQTGLNLQVGPLMQLGLFDLNNGSRLLIAIHHLVIDGISWRILFEDIETLYQQLKKKHTLQLPAKTHSFQLWATKLQTYADSDLCEKHLTYWDSVKNKDHIVITRDHEKGTNKLVDVVTVGFQLNKSKTTRLLKEVHTSFNTQINDLLLAAFFMSVREHYGTGALQLDLESHGREEILEGVDVSRSIGWFTSIYPLLLEPSSEDLSSVIKSVKESLRSVPNNGIDYLIGKYLNTNKRIGSDASEGSRISFNYLGQFDSDTKGKAYQIADESTGSPVSPTEDRLYDWDISGRIADHSLYMSLSFSGHQYEADTINALMSSYEEHLIDLINFCSNYGSTELTPSDLSYNGLTMGQLEVLQDGYDLIDAYPLSPMQEGMLFHATLDEEADHYFEQMSYCLNGDLDIVSMEKSFQTLVDRYDVLRTVFVQDGYDHPLQVVLKDKTVALGYHDIRKEILSGKREEVLDSYRISDRNKKFNLAHDALMRVNVYQTGDTEYEFIWSHHHILMDGWCMSIIINEFSALYAANRVGQEVNLPKVVPYSNYISWLQNKDKKISEDYWKAYLEGYDSLAGLPSDGIRQIDSVRSILSTTLTLSIAQTKELKQLSRRYGVTLNTIIQTCWAILLARYNNVNDVVFGAVVSGRPAEVEGIETMVGLFINSVPVRISYDDGESISDLLKKVQEKALISEPHHHHPLSEIQSASTLGMGLLDHILIFENYPVAEEIEKAGAEANGKGSYTVSNVEVFEQTNYDLAIVVVPGEETSINFHYNSEIYDGRMIDKASCHLAKTIEQVIEDPECSVSTVEMLSPEEQTKLIHGVNETLKEYPGENTILCLYETQVNKNSAVAALIFGEQQLSYQAFDKKVNKVSNYLSFQGITTGDVIGVMSDASIDLMVYVYAILKVGGVYLPIDKSYPSARINFISTNSKAKIIVCNKEDRSLLDPEIKVLFFNTQVDAYSDVFERAKILSSDLAYIIYTSGSTGLPKGVKISHGSLYNYIRFAHDTYIKDELCPMALFTSISFDLTITSMFVPLTSGSQLYVYASESPELLIQDVFASNEAKIIKLTPSHLKILLESGTDFSEVKRLIVGGESFDYQLAARVHEHSHGKVEIYNEYGPTEATVGCVLYQYDHSVQTSNLDVPIGTPISNTSIYILDSLNRIQPIGVPGELFIGGAGLAEGYLNNGELTSKKFIQNPFKKNDRIYKTGDLARWSFNGNIEYLGRLDEQVKIRGHRIELGEIESQMSKHSEINETAVLAWDRDGDKHLVGYYVSKEQLETDTIQSHLYESLPGYMVPSYFVHLDSFPLTPNGKLDRKSLPDPLLSAGEDYEAPSNDIEIKLVEIWSDISNLEKEIISVNKSLFELGGHSLKATMLVNRIAGQFDIKVPLKVIFHTPTIKALAQFIRSLSGELGNSEVNKDAQELIF